MHLGKREDIYLDWMCVFMWFSSVSQRPLVSCAAKTGLLLFQFPAQLELWRLGEGEGQGQYCWGAVNGMNFCKALERVRIPGARSIALVRNREPPSSRHVAGLVFFTLTPRAITIHYVSN